MAIPGEGVPKKEERMSDSAVYHALSAMMDPKGLAFGSLFRLPSIVLALRALRGKSNRAISGAMAPDFPRKLGDLQ